MRGNVLLLILLQLFSSIAFATKKRCVASVVLATHAKQSSPRRGVEFVRKGMGQVSAEYAPPVLNYQTQYPPLPYFHNGNHREYWDRAFRASTEERSLVIKHTTDDGSAPIGFSSGFDKSTVIGSLYGREESPTRFGGIVLGKKQFKALNSELDSSGMCLLFRVYSWRHLGFDGGGPHMSVLIGGRVYEIGRPLGKSTKEVAAGPLAMSLDDFLEKARLESEELSATPSVFLARRFSGVGEAELKALAAYYEKEAQDFLQNARFKYVANPADDPDGRNCVTYLTEPMQNPALTQNLNLQRALGAMYFAPTPMEMLLSSGHWAKAYGKPLGYKTPFMVVDQEKRQLLPSHTGQAIEPGTEWASPVFGDGSLHPQLSRFFMSDLRFFNMPLPR